MKVKIFDESCSFLTELISETFVNREDELKAILRIFERSLPVRLVSIQGDGGSGKTWLMYKAMMDFAETGRYHVASSAIDFYLTEFHSQGGIRRGIVQRLGEQNFPKFTSLLKDIQRLRDLGSESDSVSILMLEKNAAEIFVEEFRGLTNLRNVVLAFDTFEQIQDGILARWLLFELLPRLEGACVILSGRRNGEIDFQNLSQYVTPVSIGLFGRNEIAALFKRREVPEISESLLAKVIEFTRGKPLLLELTIDWLKDDLDFQKIVKLSSYEKFEESIVAAIRQLRKPEYLAILYLAWAYRRCDVFMLRHLMAKDEIDYDKLVKQLSRLSFIKFRKPISSILLHDIMRELVVKHVWTVVDPTAADRVALSQRILDYYEKVLIPAAQSDYDRGILDAEMVFYTAYANLGRSYEHFARVFDNLANRLRYDECELLLWEISEISRSSAGFSLQRLKEIDIRRAKLMVIRHDFNSALSFINDSISAATDERFRLHMLLIRAECYDRTGKIREALADRQEAVKLAEEVSISRDDRGKAHSELGYSYRIVGKWDSAIESLQTALQYTTDLGEIANIYNTIGFVYALKTDYENASQYCLEGLKLRRQIGHRKGEAWSLSTLGEIWRYKENYFNALNCYEEALRIFAEGRDQENQARVYQQRGLCYVQMGEFDKARKDFDLAFTYYKQFPSHREYPRALSRYARLYLGQNQLMEAARQLELAKRFAHEISDVDTEIYAIFRLAYIAYRKGESLDRISEFRNEMEEIIEYTSYQNQQHQGQIKILIGHKNYDGSNYEDALTIYADGLRQIAAQHTGTYLISDYLEEISRRMDSLPPQTRIEWCDVFLRTWKADHVLLKHPEMETFCRIRRQTALLALEQEANVPPEDSTNRYPA